MHAAVGLSVLYGPGDNYHPTNSHVLPALIRRFHEALEANAPSVTCWGIGFPVREFLNVDGLGEACLISLKHLSPVSSQLTYQNVGTGIDLSIRELAEAVSCATGFRGLMQWDTRQPEGTSMKQLDVSRLASLGWSVRIPLPEGLESTVSCLKKSLAEQFVRS